MYFCGRQSGIDKFMVGTSLQYMKFPSQQHLKNADLDFERFKTLKYLHRNSFNVIA